jgi:hypothetical protein
MFWTIVLGVTLRTGQIIVECSMTLACGFIVAGVMRRMLGAAGTRRLFGGPGLKGLFRAWAIGTLLPVCSLGVIPIAREMRRAGVRSGTLLAFVLAAPHINPISLLYGLTLSEPVVVICFAAASLVVALAAGFLWDRVLGRSADDPPDVGPDGTGPGDEPMPPYGIKRLTAVLVTAAREAAGPTMGYVAIGLLATGLIAGSLPQGLFSHTMQHFEWQSPLIMSAIALPLYCGPLQGMMRLGLMFEHGNSVAASFVLFELGIGVNLGMVAWLATQYGWKRIIYWLGLICVVTLGLAYAMDHPLYFAAREEDHTHAFDEWCNLFPSATLDQWWIVRDRLVEKLEVIGSASLGILVLLIALGGILSLDRRGAIDAYLLRQPAAATRPKTIWNRELPGPLLGGLALLALLGFSIVALYVYYPTPADTFDEIRHVRADAWDAVTTGRRDEAIRLIQHWDLLTRKLQVGAFIRSGKIDRTATEVTEDLRESLEDVRDALLAHDLAKARSLLPEVGKKHLECQASFKLRR